MRLGNWLKAKPWRVHPIVRDGWRYPAIYRSARQGSWHPGKGRWVKGAEPKGRLRSLRLTVAFPHVHDEYDPQEAMLAVLRAGSRVRGGYPHWLKGAPTHVLAELLNELGEEGYEIRPRDG